MWSDNSIARMSRDERLLFIGMVTIADDEGRLPASAAALTGAIYPHDEIAPKKVKEWRDAVCAKNPNVHLYAVDGREYIAFKKWADWQKPSHPVKSQIPKPSRTVLEAVAS